MVANHVRTQAPFGIPEGLRHNRSVKYLNNIVEQDHRFIKRITRPMMGFKAFHSAAATIAGIETSHMIRKGQIPANGSCALQSFAELAA